MQPKVIIVFALIVALAWAQSLKLQNVQGISVSGLSAGAFFAVQFSVAYSQSVSGAGIVAGGPFYCAQGTMMKALSQCMSVAGMNVDELVRFTKSLTSKDRDDLSFLYKQKLYLFSGLSDTVVAQNVMRQLYNYYTKVGVPVENIVTKFDISAQHAFITSDYGNSCQSLGAPYISNCEYDSAGAMLKQIYGAGLKAPVQQIDANLRKFDQTPYLESGATMLSTGYIYVPTACQSNSTTCTLHISFHGCNQNTDAVGDAYVKHTGLNNWAESNNIVVLYPQAAKAILKNPNACFDWFGYTSNAYYGKQGIQMRSVQNMAEALTGKKL